ncbi:hypothetical protein C8R44DRAFT_880826 [Mycena epipterygia]|nr:hypothetical protein C8R44DRAFT_880826 [Mycena epipterygia]
MASRPDFVASGPSAELRGECSRLNWDMEPSAPYDNMGGVYVMHPSLIRRRRGQRHLAAPYVPRPPAPDMLGPYGHGLEVTSAPVIITRPECYRDKRPPVRSGPSAADLRTRNSDATLLARLAASSKDRDKKQQAPRKRKAVLDNGKDRKRARAQ